MIPILASNLYYATIMHDSYYINIIPPFIYLFKSLSVNPYIFSIKISSPPFVNLIFGTAMNQELKLIYQYKIVVLTSIVMILIMTLYMFSFY